MADAIDTAEDVGAGILGGIGGAIAGFAVAGPLGAIAGGVAGAVAGASVPNFTEVDAADMFSVLTEGSVLSRGNLYIHRSDGPRSPACRTSVAARSTFRRCRASRPLRTAPWCGRATRRRHPYIDLSSVLRRSSTSTSNIFPGSARRAELVDGQRRAAAGGAAGRRRHHRIRAQEIAEADLRGAHARLVPQGPVRRGASVRTSARCNHDSARWFFGRTGDSYVGLFCALETTWTDNGPWKDKEIRVGGPTNVFITQIGCAADFGSSNGSSPR